MVGAEEVAKIEERKSQKELAALAFRQCQDEILGTETFSADEARRLGGIFLARLHEYELFYEDQVHLENETDTGEGSWHSPYERGSIEKAFFDAQKGDYGKFKEVLASYGNTSWKNGLGGKLATMAQLIPDQGEPFRPPQPAWQDPEFTHAKSAG